jgi:hypothetical protein
MAEAESIEQVYAATHPAQLGAALSSAGFWLLWLAPFCPDLSWLNLSLPV